MFGAALSRNKQEICSCSLRTTNVYWYSSPVPEAQLKFLCRCVQVQMCTRCVHVIILQSSFMTSLPPSVFCVSFFFFSLLLFFSLNHTLWVKQWHTESFVNHIAELALLYWIRGFQLFNCSLKSIEWSTGKLTNAYYDLNSIVHLLDVCSNFVQSWFLVCLYVPLYFN